MGAMKNPCRRPEGVSRPQGAYLGGTGSPWKGRRAKAQAFSAENVRPLEVLDGWEN